jgi:hypothetical protein
MGCDINVVVQRRGDAGWEVLDLPPHVAANLQHRNYSLFGILAGVRDGGATPISRPRGLPGDLKLTGDDEIALPDGESRVETVRSGCCCEIASYDWSQPVRRVGVVHHRDYWAWNKYGRAEWADPRSSCQGVSGPGIVVVPDEEGQKLPMPDRGAPDTGGTYVSCTWSVTAAYAAGAFYTTALPWLLSQACGDPACIRLVFGFDS